jgi:KUP system potassium uptake protein
MFPDWALIPMVALATMATIIASQAGITGAFSLTQQAIQLKLLPRMQIKQTSESERGQIYIAKINWLLLAGVIAVVLMFRSSESLTAAYGIAVSGTMVITAMLAYFVAWRVWNWPRLVAALVIAPFLLFDLAFLIANSVKFMEGGWLPLLFGAILLTVMLTWWRGSRLLSAQQVRESLAIDSFLPSLPGRIKNRVDGTAIYFSPRADEVPPALLHNLKHNKVLHENTVFLTIETSDEPRIPPEKRARLEPLIPGFTRVTLCFGFMEVPHVPRALVHCRKLGWKFETMKTSFFMSKRTLRCSQKTQMPWWQDLLFVRLSNTQSDASVHFHIPSERAIELGRQVSI